MPMNTITKLKYGNTNTFFVRGDHANILIDTDYAGTLTAFFKEIKRHDIQIKDVTYILATHYHPDHIGLIGELTSRGQSCCLSIRKRNLFTFPTGYSKKIRAWNTFQ